MLHDLIATSSFGLEAVVKRELAALGYPARSSQTGRIAFTGDDDAVARTNLWLRCADRVLVRIGHFEASNFETLFEGVKALPWERWIPGDGCFPVAGRSVRSELRSVPAVQRCVKKAIATRLLKSHRTTRLPETGPTVAVEIALLKDVATLTIDTTGEGLHKRGYRDLSGAAPLRETLAAALVQLSFWKGGRPLLDPFCGTGTICVEAALIGRNMAPGRQRRFSAEAWPALDHGAWQRARAEAADSVTDNLAEPIIGCDIDPSVVTIAQRHAIRADVADSIHFRTKPFADLQTTAEYGCLVTNPPYGHRLDERAAVEPLYQSIPLVLRRMPTWSFFILSSWNDFERLSGRPADRRRKLYSGSLECTYYQFHGPRPGEAGALAGPVEEVGSAEKPVFGGLHRHAKNQADVFANRLRKMDRHRRRWPTRRGITCYRIYNRDVPEVPLMVDRYADCLHIAEYQRPHDRSPAEHADWIDLMVRTAQKVLDVPPERTFVKHRQPQRGARQYERIDTASYRRVVEEDGLRFKVNLSDYVDTGLFLDHRITRAMVRAESRHKEVLNLFAYTGSFSVYAAAGGARRVTSVDLSGTYLDWAADNMSLNGIDLQSHCFVRTDAGAYIADHRPTPTYDLAVVDPPTFSNSKRTGGDWEIQKDHGALIQKLVPLMRPGGIIYFATNFRRFHLEEAALAGMSYREISDRTVPEDFANKRTHRCWRIALAR